MKKLSVIGLSLLVCGAIACNDNASKDSVEKSDSANQVKRDSASMAMDSTHSNMDTASNQTAMMDKASTDFLTKAADGGMLEVELGQLAQQNASSARVKNFGSMMVSDHSKANDELKVLAHRKNVTVPAMLSDKSQKMKDNLSKKTGADFDKAYMKMMVDDHKEDVSEFEKASGKVKDMDVKAFADKTLPVLKTHLDSAKAISKM